jgi:aldehyde:ferredoxin oxidoreductase
LLELIDQINLKQGLGKELGEGVKHFSEKIGGEEFAVHVKGLETPMHEPRGKKGLGISYAVSPRGCSHLEGLQDTMIEGENSSPELGAVEPISRFTLEGKIEIVKNFEDARSFTNSLIQCVFTVNMAGGSYNLHLLRNMYSAITGEKLDASAMLKIGSTIFDLGREFSHRHGLRTSHDGLPHRFKNEMLTFTDHEDAINEEELKKYLDEYYKLRGWDDEGRPKRK